ncbi:MAG: hypothetical protein IIW35_05160 [Bacteroidaceae bacterium]|nr:hypothetical protein [Bacteroidaceae bacterium]
MLGKMRVISSVVLSAAILLLLTFRVLPHHHHTLHIPGSDAVVETLHYGLEDCHEGDDASHGNHGKCPSEHTFYIVKACEELDYYNYTQSFDFSPAVLPASVEQMPLSAVSVHAPPYKNFKIPDGRARVLSLRAPPYAV